LEAAGSGLCPVILVYTGTTLSNLANRAVFSSWYYEPKTVGEFTVKAGETYWLSVVGNWWMTQGGVELSLSFASSPSNDDFANRTVLVGASFVVTNNLGAATSETGEPTYSPTAETLWWIWTATNTGQVTLGGTGSCGTIAMGVYTGDSLSNLTEVVSGSGMIHFQAIAGTAYQIVQRTDSCQDIQAMATLQLEAAGPTNDYFTNRTVVGGVPLTVSGNDFNATTELGEPGWLLTGRTLWWAWTAPSTGLLTLSTTGSSSRPMVAILSGTELTNLVFLGGNMDFQNVDRKSVV
jgi:hypothetical protein